MGIYLNPDSNRYERLCNSPVFVDKSLLIEYTNKAINTSNDCICVTRPRRFGKSTDANMLVAYYSEYIKLDRDKSTFKSHRDFSSEKEISFKHF